MKVRAELVARKRGNSTLCHPSAGYTQEMEIDPNDYVKASTISGKLPESDSAFPESPPLSDYIKLGNQLLRKK